MCISSNFYVTIDERIERIFTISWFIPEKSAVINA